MSQGWVPVVTPTASSRPSVRPPPLRPPPRVTTGKVPPRPLLALRTHSDHGALAGLSGSGSESGAPTIPEIGPRVYLVSDCRDTVLVLGLSVCSASSAE